MALVSLMGHHFGMFRVRRARAADYGALRCLWHQLDQLHAELHPEFFNDGVESHRSPAWLAHAIGARDRTVLVVVDAQDRVVAAVTLRVYETPRDPQLVSARRAHLDDFVVDQERRRRGVGRLLFSKSVQWVQARGARQLMLTVWRGNDAAEAFYRRVRCVELSRVYAIDVAGAVDPA